MQNEGAGVQKMDTLIWTPMIMYVGSFIAFLLDSKYGRRSKK